MTRYPEILLPKSNYPMLSNDEVLDCALVRETTTDLYPFLSKTGYSPDDIVRFVVAPQPSLREVFELSVFLYGYYDEQCIGIRIKDRALYADWTADKPEMTADAVQFTQETAYPLFLSCSKLDRQEIDFNGEAHILSFSHKPTRVNYWHFELWVKDSTGTRIPRDKSSAHTRYLAKALMEYIVEEAIIQKAGVKPYRSTEI